MTRMKSKLRMTTVLVSMTDLYYLESHLQQVTVFEAVQEDEIYPQRVLLVSGVLCVSGEAVISGRGAFS